MTNRRPAFAVALALGLATVVAVSPRMSAAQTEDELQAARDLFQEAYQDEQEKRYPEALEKFRRVAEVKESPSVRYRIAAVLEAMGRLREARDAYRAIAAMKDSLPPKDEPIAESAAVRAVEVDKKIPKVVVSVAGEHPPPDAAVTVDGAPVPVGRPVEQDPGEHVVQARATGMKPYEQHVTLPDDGSQVPATVTFESATPPPPDGKRGAGTGGSGRNKTLGYIALGAGGVLLTTGIVLLVAREGAIDDINTLCPDPNACPASREPDVRSDQDRANLFLPLGVGFIVVGAAAAGFGAYTLIKKPSGGEATQQPSQSARVRVAPSYVRGGAMLGLRGSF